MNQLFDKILQIEKELSLEMGKFYLFALFQTSERAEQWDVVVSASWLVPGLKGIKIISGKLTSNLEENELLKISKVVVLENDNPIVEQLARIFDVEHEFINVQSLFLVEKEIEKAIVITAKSSTKRHAA